jgi:TolB protein
MRRLAATSSFDCGAAVALLVLASAALPASSGYSGANGKIAFARYLPSGPQIYAVTPRGAKVTRLVRHKGEDDQPAWSPDGKRVAFASLTGGTQGLFVADTPDKGVRRLTTHPFDPQNPILDAHPRWSPNGRQIVFHRFRPPSTFELYLVDTNGRSPPRKLGPGFEPNWSPDGRKIAYAYRASEDDDFDLYMMDANGAGRRRLTNGPVGESGAEWSPDGRRIAFVRTESLINYEIYSMPAAGGAEKRLTTSAAADVSPSWSPDGRKIAFASRRVATRWDIYVMNADGTGQKRITRNPLDDAQPSWQRLPKRR